MKKLAIVITAAALVAAFQAARAQIALPWPGPGMPAAAGSSCGTGVIDTSAGCPLPMLGM